MLNDWKSYTVAVLLGVVTFAHFLNMIDDNTRDSLTGILLGGGVAALKHAIVKSGRNRHA